LSNLTIPADGVGIKRNFCNELDQRRNSSNWQCSPPENKMMGGATVGQKDQKTNIKKAAPSTVIDEKKSLQQTRRKFPFVLLFFSSYFFLVATTVTTFDGPRVS